MVVVEGRVGVDAELVVNVVELRCAGRVVVRIWCRDVWQLMLILVLLCLWRVYGAQSICSWGQIYESALLSAGPGSKERPLDREQPQQG